MKKTFLAAMALIVAFAFTFTACNKAEEEKTTEELLTQTKGWVLTSGTSFPAFVPIEGEPSEDLFKSFFEECELDDINIFKPNRDLVLNYGKELCDGQSGKETTLGRWKFIEDKVDVIQFYLAAYYDDNGNYEPLEAKIIKIDENTLQLRIPIYEYVKSVEPQYHFTLTYKVAK
jgi:hypothetical protein